MLGRTNLQKIIIIRRNKLKFENVDGSKSIYRRIKECPYIITVA